MKTPVSRPIRLVLGAVLLLGALLRLLEYFENRPLWFDEAMLALGIGQGDYRSLLTPLPLDQVAPPLFLLSVKSATLIGGMGEYALRFVPLVAGLLLPWVIWRMTRELGGTAAGLIAAALAAISVSLIYHTVELKPYGVDALASACVILLTLRARAEPDRRERWSRLVFGGAIGLLFSIPLPLVLGGALAALLADARVRSAPEFRRRVLVLMVVWGGVAAVLYGWLYRPMATEFLHRFWAETFLDPGAADAPLRAYGAGVALLQSLPPTEGIIPLRWLVLLLGAGVVLLVRRAGLPGTLQLVVPFAGLLAASALRQYPIGPRVLVFLAPCAIAFVAVLLAEVLRLVRLREPVAAVVGASLVLLWGGPAALDNAHHPEVRHEGRRSALRVMRSDASEPVFVTPSGLPSWAYYTTDWARPDTARLGLMLRAGVSTGAAAANALVDEVPPRGAAPSLTYAGTGRLELFGHRSGLSFREPHGFAQGRPDSGWARAEVDRIVAVARPYAWVYGVHWVAEEFADLRAEFIRRGIVIVESAEEVRALALRIRVPAPAPQQPGYRPPATARP